MKRIIDLIKYWGQLLLLPIWITLQKKIVEHLREHGYEAYYFHSLKGIFYCFMVKIYIFDNYSKDISFCTSGGVAKMNLY